MASSNSWIDVSNSAPPQSPGRSSTMPPSGRNTPMSSTSSTLKSTERKPPSLREKTPVVSTPKSSGIRPSSIEPSVYEKVCDWLRTVRIENGSQGFVDCDGCLSLNENRSDGRRYGSGRGYVHVEKRVRGGRDENEGSAAKSDDGHRSPEKAINVNTKTTKKKKRKCNVFTRLNNTGESVVDLNTAEGLTRLVHAIHPKVVCGHKNCLTADIVTPKRMGWLWTVQKFEGIRVSRNWKPGAIPKNVAIVMEMERMGYYKKMAEKIVARKAYFDCVTRTRRKKIFEKHLGYVPSSSDKLITKSIEKPQMTNIDVVSSGNYSDSIVSS